jgi:putative flippase GtrA
MVRLIADLYERIRHLVPELAKFGVVGGIGAVVDLGGAAVLHSAFHEGALESKAISITAATVVTYAGSRFWTFRHRENQPMAREAVLFIALNLVGLVLAEAVIAFTTYALGLQGPLAYNAASVFGTGLGTIFRFYAYRKWVFLAPAGMPAPSTGPMAALMEVPDYPPWELDPAFFEQPVDRFPPVRLEDPFIPNGHGAPPLVSAGASTGPNPRATSADLRGTDSRAPESPSPRSPGRHRRSR